MNLNLRFSDSDCPLVSSNSSFVHNLSYVNTLLMSYDRRSLLILYYIATPYLKCVDVTQNLKWFEMISLIKFGLAGI